MTTTDYLINGLFVLVVLRQSRERALDRRCDRSFRSSWCSSSPEYLHYDSDRRQRPGVLSRCSPRPASRSVFSRWLRHPRSCRRRRTRACAGRLDRGPAAGRGNRLSDGVCVCGRPWCRARDPQLQHRPSDRRGGLAGGTGLDGDLRGHDPDRDGAASWPPHDGCSAGSCDRVTRFATVRGVRPVSAGRTAFYRSSAVSMREESARVADARARAESRLARQRGTLRPLGLVLIAVVVVTAINGHPAPAAHGTGLGVAVAIARVRGRSRIRDPGLVHGAEHRRSGCGDRGDGGGRRCARRAAAARGDRSCRRCSRLDGGRPLAARARSRDRRCGRGRSVRRDGAVRRLVGGRRRHGAPVRAARGDCPPDQAGAREPGHNRAAAGPARGRARGAARRRLRSPSAAGSPASCTTCSPTRSPAQRSSCRARGSSPSVSTRAPQVRAAIDRAGELVKDGLANARQAVGALRGEELPGIAQLESLVDELQGRHERRRHADDRRQLAGAPGRTRALRSTAAPRRRSPTSPATRPARRSTSSCFGTRATTHR